MKHSARKASVKPSSRAASKRRVVKSPIKKRAAPASKRKAEPNKVRDVRRASLLHIADLEGQIAAIDKAQAVIEFTLDGHIIKANDNFLSVMGYSAAEVIGQHHGMFVEPDRRNSLEYRQFWEKLGRGEYDAGQYKRIGKNGREVWIQASYNPIYDLNGKPFKVVKYATDITAQRLQAADVDGQLAAIDKAQAVIEFTLDGRIIKANENFLSVMGYSAAEVIGQHHSMFVEPDQRNSLEYRQFWEKLGRGEYDARQYRRIGKNGREVWIQASYNPILDLNGKPFKVVKYATDISQQTGVFNDVVRVLSALAQGDLTERIDSHYDGKFGALKNDANTTVDQLTLIVSQIKQASDTINTAAAEIAAGNQDLSSRTEEQAASLEETASSMEELTSTVKQNAENARQANQLAIGASDIALKGGRVVGEVVTTMSAIDSSSRKIVDIISVIDGIAFQTNILALNAAVEAARAGEQGRGFAVVAAEVRNLAQRSAAAAKEIKSLISDSVERVGAGSKLVEQAGKTMDEIVSSVRRVTDIMAQITEASEEQSQGIEQVNRTVSQMDQVTQQNAALVEEATASARAMEEQADGLRQTISQFRLSTQVSEAPLRSSSVVPLAPVVRRNERAPLPAAVKAESKRPASPRRIAGMGFAQRSDVKDAAAGGDSQWQEF